MFWIRQKRKKCLINKKKGYVLISYGHLRLQSRTKSTLNQIFIFFLCNVSLFALKGVASEPSSSLKSQISSTKANDSQKGGVASSLEQKKVLKKDKEALSQKIQISKQAPAGLSLQETKPSKKIFVHRPLPSSETSKIQVHKSEEALQIDESQKIKKAIQSPPKMSSFEKKVKGKKISFIDMFNTELFSEDMEKASEDSMAKFYERRSKIIGTEKTQFSAWWKLGMDINLTLSEILGTDNLHYGITPDVAFKGIAQIHPWVFVEAEFELFNRVGTTQSLFEAQRQDGIKQIEFVIEVDPPSDSKLNFFKGMFGNVNQENLGSIDHAMDFPLLFSDEIVFPAIVAEVDFSEALLSPTSKHKPSLSLQGALPTNIADDEIFSSSFKDIPVFTTVSIFYDTQFNLKQWPLDINLGGSWFSFWNQIPGDIAQKSRNRGNIVTATRTLGDFAGIYANLNASLSFPFYQKLALNGGLQGIWNYAEEGTNICYILSTSVHWDYSDNSRFTVTGERFEKQSNCSVSFYSSTRYANHGMEGWVGELNWDMYNRNATIGFRYSRASEFKKTTGSYNSFLLYARTNYAKIY